MRATAQLVQGLPNPELPIAQLPGMTLEQAKENGELSGMGWQRRMNVGKGEEKRGGEQGKVAEELPVLEVNDVFFQGESTHYFNSKAGKHTFFAFSAC